MSPTPQGLRAEKALKMAVAGVIKEHRRLGLPIAVMKNGKSVFVSVNKEAKSIEQSVKRSDKKGGWVSTETLIKKHNIR